MRLRNGEAAGSAALLPTSSTDVLLLCRDDAVESVPATHENGAVRIRTLELVDPRPVGSKLVSREQAEIVCEDGRGLFFISRASNSCSTSSTRCPCARSGRATPLECSSTTETSCGWAAISTAKRTADCRTLFSVSTPPPSAPALRLTVISSRTGGSPACSPDSVRSRFTVHGSRRVSRRSRFTDHGSPFRDGG